MKFSLSQLLFHGLNRALCIYRQYKLKKSYKMLIDTIEPNKLTHYPDKKHKPISQVKSEIMALLISGKGSWTPETTIQDYFFFGCDCTENNVADFVFPREYKFRSKLNAKLGSILDHKHVAGIYLKARGINASCALGEIDEQGIITLMNGQRYPFAEWFKSYGHPLFCKPNDGHQGSGCCRLELTDSESPSFIVNGRQISNEEFNKNIVGKIVEPLIIQHAELLQYSPHCVNPLRIRTVYHKGNFEVISIYICFGGHNAYWANGVSSGAMVALNSNGQCISDVFCEMPGKDGRSQYLPDSEIPVSNIIVPGVKQAIDLALAAHKTLPQIHSIGWDVAVTDDGPIIIEGNSDYGPVTYQYISGKGERAIFNKYFGEFLQKN